MGLAKTLEASMTSDDVLRILPTLPQGIGKKLSPLLQAADMETYKHFLVTMYHYTHYALDQLKYAEDMCEDSELKAYFAEMAREEDGHHLLAKRDFERLGGNLEDCPAPASVQSFRNYWYGLGKENVNEFLGAMYVFENVASAVAKDIIDMMARLNLKRSQATWLNTHIEADVGHGDEAWKMCAQYAHHNPDTILRAAKEGASEWMAVFEHAFSNNG
jgi:hypothetical protein